MRLRWPGLAMLALVACGQAGDRQARSDKPQPAAASNDAAPAIPPPGTGPDAKTPFAPVKPAADPKGPEAAREVVRSYGELIADGRWDDAQKLWGSPETAAVVAASLKSSRDLYLETGPPSAPEGAAGSIYVTVPVTLYRNDKQNEASRRAGSVILRRVNDVPGSTEAQRRWHIERIDWTGN